MKLVGKPANDESAREKLSRKTDSEKRPSPKAVVVAQFKEQTIQYKAKVDQLNSELHKVRGEARHYKELANKLKDDLGALLKRSFHMLRDARDKATEYKQQLDEVRDTMHRGGNREARLSMSSARSQGSSDLEMPVAPWWIAPPKGDLPLFDELDEKFENGQPHPKMGRDRPRRTIGPSPIFEAQRTDTPPSNVEFEAFDKYLFI